MQDTHVRVKLTSARQRQQDPDPSACCSAIYVAHANGLPDTESDRNR
jgi:hypothetical protein